VNFQAFHIRVSITQTHFVREIRGISSASNIRNRDLPGL
jgi:hypothetical protein